MKIGCLLSIRNKATRLPGKVLHEISGRPIFLQLLERLSRSNEIDELIVSTSKNDNDSILADIAENNGYLVYRGSEEDKLKRYYDTMKFHGLDCAIIVDGDDPFCFIEGIDALCREFRETNVDALFLSEVPLGAGSNGFRMGALEKVLKHKIPEDTEVWGGYFLSNPLLTCKHLRLDMLQLREFSEDIRLTVDYSEDMLLVEKIYEHFGNNDFSSSDLMYFLNVERPELKKLNISAQAKYERHISEASPVVFNDTIRAELKVLVIGLGSMGKRRIRNLISNGLFVSNISGYDTQVLRRAEAKDKYNINILDKIDVNLLRDQNLIIISTPPDKHSEYILLSLEAEKNSFIEASVLDDDFEKIMAHDNFEKQIIYPSNTMNFFAGPQFIQDCIKNNTFGTPLLWQYQSGQYLPDWHPWENISDFYVSNRATGGCREIVPFELTWLVRAFGKVSEAGSSIGSAGQLNTEIDEFYAITLKHNCGVVGQLLVDVLSRFPTRRFTVTCSRGTLVWDDGDKLVKYYDASTGEWMQTEIGLGSSEEGYINPEEPYEREIDDFLKVVFGMKDQDYTLEDDKNILQTLYQIERARSSMKEIN